MSLKSVLALALLAAAVAAWLYLDREREESPTAPRPPVAHPRPAAPSPAAPVRLEPARSADATARQTATPPPSSRRPRQLAPALPGDPDPPELPAGYLEPLLYPEDHACAGHYRAGVTGEQVSDAVTRGMGDLVRQNPALEVPLLALVDVKISLVDARNLTPGLDWGSDADRVRIYETLRDSGFSNPDAPKRSFIFPAPEGHREAITRAALLRSRTLDRELDALAQRPASCETNGP